MRMIVQDPKTDARIPRRKAIFVGITTLVVLAAPAVANAMHARGRH